MRTYYYLSLFPLEGLIASQLDPLKFGLYMSTGKKNGSFERIVFLEIEGEKGTAFNWDYARERCVPHADGTPKNSVWMSVYRTLERISLDQLKSLYLTTADGRTLELKPSVMTRPEFPKAYYVYQEICPVTPLVVSGLDPVEFCTYMTNPEIAVSVPKIVFCDIRAVEVDSITQASDTGPVYDKNLGHLKECIAEIRSQSEKANKNLERSFLSFAYNIIDRGLYIGDGTGVVAYPMPSHDEIRRNHYDWGRSAMVL